MARYDYWRVVTMDALTREITNCQQRLKSGMMDEREVPEIRRRLATLKTIKADRVRKGEKP